MTTRQRTAANIALLVFAALMIAAAIVSWRMYDASAAAASTRADVTASELADAREHVEYLTAQVADVTGERDRAVRQRDDALADAEQAAATLEGQYQVNADYADQIADLKARLTTAQDAATKAPAAAAPRFYEDGSWVAGEASGCAPSALCDDEYQDKVAAEHEQEVADAGAQQVDTSMLPSGSATWHGFSVGEVIVCPAGWDVSIDDGDTDGETWAACM